MYYYQTYLFRSFLLRVEWTSCSSFPFEIQLKASVLLEYIESLLFLVGAFSFKEKSPTITVSSFFFRQTTELIAYVPLFTETDKFTQASSTNANLLQRVPPFVFFYLFNVTCKTGRLQRVPPFNLFSALCEFFFEIF